MGIIIDEPTLVPEIGLTLSGLLISTHGRASSMKNGDGVSYTISVQYDTYADETAFIDGKLPLIPAKTLSFSATDTEIAVLPVYILIFNALKVIYPKGRMYQPTSGMTVLDGLFDRKMEAVTTYADTVTAAIKAYDEAKASYDGQKDESDEKTTAKATLDQCIVELKQAVALYHRYVLDTSSTADEMNTTSSKIVSIIKDQIDVLTEALSVAEKDVETVATKISGVPELVSASAKQVEKYSSL